MKVLRISDLIAKKLQGYEVAGVWLKELQALVNERNALSVENHKLRTKVKELEAKVSLVEDMVFVDLKV